MSLELILGGVLAAILAGFGLYFKGKSKGEKDTRVEVAEQKAEESKAVSQERIDKVKGASNAQSESSSLPAGAASDRLFDEFNRDR